MAPLGMVDMLGGFSSAEVGVISLVVFVVLGVALLGLCALCRRSHSNAYDVSDGKTAERSAEPADPEYTTWRDHRNMPQSTLSRTTDH